MNLRQKISSYLRRVVVNSGLCGLTENLLCLRMKNLILGSNFEVGILLLNYHSWLIYLRKLTDIVRVNLANAVVNRMHYLNSFWCDKTLIKNNMLSLWTYWDLSSKLICKLVVPWLPFLLGLLYQWNRGKISSRVLREQSRILD